MFKAVAIIALSFLTFTVALANDESLYTLPDVEVSITARVDQPAIEYKGDGIAAEIAGLAASIEQALAPVDPDRTARFEAELEIVEPTETGSLGLMAREEEEPLLLDAYFENRVAYEAMLTP